MYSHKYWQLASVAVTFIDIQIDYCWHIEEGMKSVKMMQYTNTQFQSKQSRTYICKVDRFPWLYSSFM